LKNSFYPTLNEVLYEEEEEDLKTEKDREAPKIPFSFRFSEDLNWDSMGILGLTSRMSRDTKNMQESYMMDNGNRKGSINSHQM